MTVTEVELKTLLLQKERDGRHLKRAELRTGFAAQFGGRDGERTQENSKQTFQLEYPKTVLTNFSQDFHSIPVDQEDITQSERLYWIVLWKNLRVDCAGGMLISTKKLDRVLSKLGKVHRIRPQRMF